MTQFELSQGISQILHTSVDDARSSLFHFPFDEKHKEIVRAALAAATENGEGTKAKLFAAWLKRADKPYGHEATVRCNDKICDAPHLGSQVKIHRKGSASVVRSAARMLPHFREVLSVEPFDQKRWIAAFGEGRM